MELLPCAHVKQQEKFWKTSVNFLDFSEKKNLMSEMEYNAKILNIAEERR